MAPSSGTADDGRTSRAILTLAGLSGSCGLAWEIIYARLFTNVFGNGFEVTGLVLASVFLGMAFGAWFSARIQSHLATIEIVIGLWSGTTALVLSLWGLDLLAYVPTGAARNLLLVGLLAPPMAMIGTCVPLFSNALSLSSVSGRTGFLRVYALYNTGAFVSVLLIEFGLLRNFGLLGTASFVACLNLFVGSGLCRMRLAPTRFAKSPANTQVAQTASAVLWNKALRHNIAAALVLASFASGVFQLLVLKLSFLVYGPLQENFAILLAAAILGVATGAGLAHRRMVSLQHLLSMAMIALLLFLLSARLLVYGWGWVHEMVMTDAGVTVSKVLLLGAPPFGVFAIFGMLVPVAVNAHPRRPDETDDPALYGQLLALSSLGNGLGSLVMFLWLYKFASMPMIFGIIIATLVVGWLGIQPAPMRRLSKACIDLSWSRAAGGAILGMILFASGLALWPETALLLGYRTLESVAETTQQTQKLKGARLFKAYDQDAALVDFDDGTRALIFNGYRSLTFGPMARAPLHEVIVGSTPGLFSTGMGKALVLGLGSGVTAGATARLYAETRVVEINPAIFEIPAHFVAENANLMQRDTVKIVLEDAVSRLIYEDTGYDAIINTVTSPKYYSASKLYTRDFYNLVKKRLAPGGVYSSWFDLNISLEGVAVMVNTLEASFDVCRYFVLAGGYFNVVCAQDPLLYQPRQEIDRRLSGTGIAEIFFRHGLPLRTPDALRKIEISFAPVFFDRPSPEINTLNRPVIEFLPISPARLDAAAQKLGQILVANIEFQRQTSFINSDWRGACQAIAWMAHLQLSGC